MDNDNFSGIINIIKPPNMTSFDVIGILRKLTKIKKIGHTGTLDPLAVGVLTVCIGKYTKLIELMVEKNKNYRVEMKLGERTTSLDSEGEVISVNNTDNIEKDDIIKCFNEFTGSIKQKPPMYSAVKVKGKKLYELARKGITIDREYRNVNINKIELVNIENDYIMFDVECSKGTYIRTLCDDIGLKLGCGAYMSFLLRTKAGDFSIEESHTLEEINNAIKDNKFNELLVDIEYIFKDRKKAYININDEKKFKNGGLINYSIENISNENKKNLPVFNDKREFIGLGEYIFRNNEFYLKPRKVF
jgi:tRNA pseudouridine55 synthase